MQKLKATNWWLPTKKQKAKTISWVLHEMLERKEQFFREIPINDAQWQHCIMVVRKI
jgi:hypothetical protein